MYKIYVFTKLSENVEEAICLKYLKKILSGILAGLFLMNSSIPLLASATSGTDDNWVWLTEEGWMDGWVTDEFEDDLVIEDNPQYADEDLEETEATETEETVPEETEVAETNPQETEPEIQETEQQDKTYDTVPLYFQDEYPDTMFGSGTVATSGCSITCLAMVATYMTDHAYFPDELAQYFGGHADNNMKRMLYGMQKLRLPYKQCANWHVVEEELQKGRVVILMVDEGSIFTNSQHFVVLTGITDDGKILVNDTNSKNYDKWDLKEKLITGFPQSDLWQGFDGAWSFNKDAMPDEPFIYEEEEIYVEPRYVGVTLTMDERELLARMVWVEARGEPLEGQQAVAEVVLNRLVAENFQDSVESIIMAQGQFNSAKFLDKAEPNQTQYEAVERALKGPYVTPINTVYFGQTPNRNGSVWGWIGGHCFSTQWVPKK